MTVPPAQHEKLCIDLASGISILEHLGIIDFNGHFSARRSDGSIVINSGRSVRSAISVEDFVVTTADGACEGVQEKPPAELPLHIAIYKVRPDVGAIVHGHPKWSTMLSTCGSPYSVMFAQGALPGDVPVYPSPRSVNNPETAGEVAATLGTGNAVLLRAHGSVVAAADIMEAAVLAIYLEMNAERQIGAALLGGDTYTFSADEIFAFRTGLRKRNLFEKCWNYYLAKIGLVGLS